MPVPALEQQGLCRKVGKTRSGGGFGKDGLLAFRMYSGRAEFKAHVVGESS
jgi:hypothetical protein